MNTIKIHFLTGLLSLLLAVNLFAQFSSTPASNEASDINNPSRRNIEINGSEFNILSLNVKIVESQSFNSGHVMDSVWRFVALGMGHNAVIVPQTTLDDSSFFGSTDILIISSGVINIPSNRVNIVKNFLMHKKNVYLQGEYLSTYQSNQAFANIVDSLGGTFSWGSTVNGMLIPMQILGSLSTTPNNVPFIYSFWYGVYGTGNNTIEYFMMYQSNYFGFVFTPPNTNYGIVICNSDQDWVRTSASLPLMQNILYKLSIIVGIKQPKSEVPEEFKLHQNYPNPFNPATRFRVEIAKRDFVKIDIYDGLGRMVSTLVNGQLNAGRYEIEWDAANYPSGVYFYRLVAGSFVDTKKMMLVK